MVFPRNLYCERHGVYIQKRGQTLGKAVRSIACMCGGANTRFLAEDNDTAMCAIAEYWRLQRRGANAWRASLRGLEYPASVKYRKPFCTKARDRYVVAPRHPTSLF